MSTLIISQASPTTRFATFSRPRSRLWLPCACFPGAPNAHRTCDANLKFQSWEHETFSFCPFCPKQPLLLSKFLRYACAATWKAGTAVAYINVISGEILRIHSTQDGLLASRQPFRPKTSAQIESKAERRVKEDQRPRFGSGSPCVVLGLRTLGG